MTQEKPVSLLTWCCIKCKDPDFQRFVALRYGLAEANEKTCVETVYNFCGIQSRSEFKTNRKAKELFIDGFIKPYERYQQQKAA